MVTKIEISQTFKFLCFGKTSSYEFCPDKQNFLQMKPFQLYLPFCILSCFVSCKGKKRIDVDTVDESYQLNIDSPVAPQPLIAAAWEQSNYDVIDLLLSFDADVCNSYTSLPETNKPKPLFYQVII